MVETSVVSDSLKAGSFVCSVMESLPHLKWGPRLHKGQPHLDVQHRGAPDFKTSSTLNVKLLFKFQGF
ncbi:mCG140389 [Mus musculus]|nr:mCG140389 [Mus musculus]